MTRTRQLVNGLAGLATSVVLVAGVPIGLARYVGWPLPTRLPTLEEAQLALRSGIDPQLLINLLAIIVWVIWGMFVWALTTETTAYLRRRTPPSRSLLPGIQTAAGRLVATVALLAATLAPIRPDVAIAHPTPLAITQAPSPTQIESPNQTQPSALSNPVYDVQRHDTLWSIAESTLGDGRRWQEIRTLNLNQPTSTGETITPTTADIPAGTSLRLPEDATVPDRVQPMTVTVKPGDSFWKIAQHVLSNTTEEPPTSEQVSAYWKKLIDANLNRLQRPYDPDVIYPNQVFVLPDIDATADGTQASTVPAGPVESTEVTTVRGDSFWSIAQAALEKAWGHPPRPTDISPYWREVVDANLDRLAHPGDPHLIHPGQVFVLPPPPDPTTAVTTSDNGQPTTAAPPADPPPINTSPDVASESGRSADPPTETPVPPTTAPASPETTLLEPVAPSHTEAKPTAEPEPEVTADAVAEPDREAPSLLPSGARIAGLGILAAGLLALINRLRRTQIRQRKPGTLPTPPPPDTRPMESMLRAAAAPTAVELVDLSLRSLAAQIKSQQLPAPHLIGVRITEELISLLLWTPHTTPPQGWQATDGGRTWQLPTSVDPTTLRLLADGTPSPYPSLLSVGHTDNAQVMIDIEFLGAVQVTGTTEQVESACHTFAVELAASQIADYLEVVCVGFAEDLAHLERVRVVDNLDDILNELADKAAAVDTFSVDSPLDGRMSFAGGDTWHPMIVIDPSSTPPDHADQLLAIAARGRAIAAVVGYSTGDRWRFHLVDQELRIEPLGLNLSRRDLTPAENDAVAGIIAAAKDLEGVPAADADAPWNLDPSPVTHGEETGDVADSDPQHAEVAGGIPTVDRPQQDAPPEHATDLPAPDDEPQLPGVVVTAVNAGPERDLKVLGQLRVEDLEQPFKLASSLEIVAYLAFHRRGVDGHVLMEAIFPEEPPDLVRINRHVSRARRVLGNDPDGTPHLLRVISGIYRVGPYLHTDVERFEAHLKAADDTTSDAEWTHLRAALDLVEGTPFSGAVAALNWAHAEGLITHLIIAADDAAHRLAELALDAGDHDTATWASRKGLLAAGSCDVCYRNLMRTAASTANRTALHALFEEMLAMVEDDDGPDAVSQLDPEAVAIYHEHVRPGLHRDSQAS